NVVRRTAFVGAHKLHFTYSYNMGAPDCILPTGIIHWASHAAAGLARSVASRDRSHRSNYFYNRRDVAKQRPWHPDRQQHLSLVQTRQLSQTARSAAPLRAADGTGHGPEFRA